MTTNTVSTLIAYTNTELTQEEILKDNACRLQKVKLDLRFLKNRRALEYQQLDSIKNEYERRSLKVVIDRKYNTIKEAIVSLHKLGIMYNYSLGRLIEEFETI